MEILNWLEDEGTTTANYLAFLLCYMLRKRNEWKVKKEIHILRLNVLYYSSMSPLGSN